MAVVRQPPKPPTVDRIALIAGGRDYVFGRDERKWLDGLNAALGITLVVHGAAPGADTGGRLWAEARGIATKAFPADWNRHGNAAGPLRNEAMANYLLHNYPAYSVVILFPGGRGTANMHALAENRNLRIILYRLFQEPAPR